MRLKNHLNPRLGGRAQEKTLTKTKLGESKNWNTLEDTMVKEVLARHGTSQIFAWHFSRQNVFKIMESCLLFFPTTITRTLGKTSIRSYWKWF
jgi:hypothetical protein